MIKDSTCARVQSLHCSGVTITAGLSSVCFTMNHQDQHFFSPILKLLTVISDALCFVSSVKLSYTQQADLAHLFTREGRKHLSTEASRVKFRAIQAITCFPVPIILEGILHGSSEWLPAALLSNWSHISAPLDDKIKSHQLHIHTLTHMHAYSAKCLARTIYS